MRKWPWQIYLHLACVGFVNFEHNRIFLALSFRENQTVKKLKFKKQTYFNLRKFWPNSEVECSKIWDVYWYLF